MNTLRIKATSLTTRVPEFHGHSDGTNFRSLRPNAMMMWSADSFGASMAPATTSPIPNGGSAGTEYLRLSSPAYADGENAPSGPDRPGARAVSNAVAAQSESRPNRRGASDFLWQWGQFVDHDIDETPSVDPAEAFDIPVPAGDPDFDPSGSGTQTIPLNRSYYNSVDGVRQQVNAITAYIDGSQVYGSSLDAANALRTLDGTGRLKTSAGTCFP